VKICASLKTYYNCIFLTKQLVFFVLIKHAHFLRNEKGKSLIEIDIIIEKYFLCI